MATENRKIQLGVGVDATGARAGFQEVKDAARDMANSVAQAGQTASKGVDAVSASSARAATAMTRSEALVRAEIQRTDLNLRALGKTASERIEIKIQMQGLDRAKLKPFLDELRATEAQAKAATAAATDFSRVTTSLGASGYVRPLGNPTTSLGATAFGEMAAGAATPAAAEKANQALRKSGAELDKYGNTVKQTQAALRGLPAQFTDIAVSLQGGQNPLTVLLQQGGQLKDMFGGIAPAARAMGSYVMGLVGPFTLGAAAVATLGTAYYKGSKETDEFRKSLILTNNAAGTSVGQLTQMAKAVSEVVGTQGAAAQALTAIVSAGGVSVSNMEKFATTAVRMQRTIGTSVEDTAKAFASLADDPLKASEKLNQGTNYLTLSLYNQIKALEDQGRKTEAAAVAQRAYDSAMDTAARKIEANMGTIEKSVQFVTDKAKGMWDALLGVGRASTLEDEVAKATANVERLRAQSGNSVVGGGGAAGAQARRRAAEQLTEEESRLRSLRQGVASQNRFAAENAGRMQREKDAIAAQGRLNDLEKASLSNAQKRAKEVAQMKRDAELTGMSLEKQNALEKQINERYKDPKTPRVKAFQDDQGTKTLQTLREQESAIKAQIDTNDKLTRADQERAKYLQLFADLKTKDVLTADQKSLLASKDAILAQLDQNVAAEKQLELKKEQAKLDEQRKRDAEEFARQIEGINISIASSNESRRDQQARSLEAFGLGDRARKEVDAQRSIRAEFERYQRQLTKSAADKGQLGSDEYKAEVEKIKQALNDALNSQADYFAKIEEKQGDWANGATAAFANYADEAKKFWCQVFRANHARLETIYGTVG